MSHRHKNFLHTFHILNRRIRTHIKRVILFLTFRVSPCKCGLFYPRKTEK